MYSNKHSSDIEALGYNSKSYFKFEKHKINFFQLMLFKLWMAVDYLQDLDWEKDLITTKYLDKYPELKNFKLWLSLNQYFGYLETIDSGRGIYEAILIIPGAFFWQAEKYKLMLILDKNEKTQKPIFPFKNHHSFLSNVFN